VVVGLGGRVNGFSGAGYSYPGSSSSGHNGTPASRYSGFLPMVCSSGRIHSGSGSVVVVGGAVVVVVVVVIVVVVVVVVVAVVTVVVVVLVVVFVVVFVFLGGRVKGISGTGYS